MDTRCMLKCRTAYYINFMTYSPMCQDCKVAALQELLKGVLRGPFELNVRGDLLTSRCRCCG
jgi:hypothetical protein